MDPTNSLNGTTIAPTRALELWATGDICDHLNVTRTTIGRWRKWPDFPPPRWTVSRGTVPIWDAAEVRAWLMAQIDQQIQR